jgi:hypothetical protein
MVTDRVPKLKIRSICKGNWPPLTWVAHCPTGSGDIDVLHGRRVETRPDWFCEAVWDGAFSAGNFDETDIVAGTGGRSADGAVVFVSSGSTVDRLQYFLDSRGLWISNSLCALLSTIGAQVDPTYPDFSADFHSIVNGLHAYKREIDTSRGAVQLVYFNNARWDGYRVSEEPKPNASRDFSSFDRYHAFLMSAMHSMTRNAQDLQRAYPYELLCPISNGHDSPTVAVLARNAGCSRAFTFDVSREGTDDSGGRIGQLLGMKTTVIARNEWRSMPLPETLFIAGAASAGEVIFKGAESLLGGSVLLTGFTGDAVWGKKVADEHGHLLRTDASGLCLTEYRLHTGFIHCPVPFWGARQAREISAIGGSKDLEQWDIGGKDARPICRRIVEDAGVPRPWFGHGKRGVSVQLFRPGRFLETGTAEDYFRWLAKTGDEWRRRGRTPPLPFLARMLDFILRHLIGVLRFMLTIKPLRRIRVYSALLSRLLHRLDGRVHISRYTFPWALARTQAFYKAEDAADQRHGPA